VTFGRQEKLRLPKIKLLAFERAEKYAQQWQTNEWSAEWNMDVISFSVSDAIRDMGSTASADSAATPPQSASTRHRWDAVVVAGQFARVEWSDLAEHVGLPAGRCTLTGLEAAYR
jgi:hypothetical protein